MIMRGLDPEQVDSVIKNGMANLIHEPINESKDHRDLLFDHREAILRSDNFH
jgi:hypothetical protein